MVNEVIWSQHAKSTKEWNVNIDMSLLKCGPDSSLEVAAAAAVVVVDDNVCTLPLPINILCSGTGLEKWSRRSPSTPILQKRDPRDNQSD